MGRHSLIPHLAALILAAGCAGSDAGSGTIERDSAGIRIVENRHDRPAWTERTAWRLSSEPIVRIGAVSGDSSQLLYRVTHASRLHDGRIAVVNAGTRQVRFYDTDGSVLGAIGGAGDGPGEFRSPWMVHELPGDSLLVIDLYREISIFDPGGNFVRRFLPTRPDGSMGEGFEPVDQFGDGSLLFRSHYPQTQRPAGLSRNRIQMVRVLTDGTPGGSLGDYDDQTGMGGTQYLFGPWAKEAAAGSTMWYGPGDAYELREIDFDGNVLRLVRLDRPPRPVTADDISDFVDYAIAQVANTPREQFARRLYADPQHAEHFPAHFEIMVDGDGNLWVQDYHPFHLRVARSWDVFDPEGHYLGAVTMPESFTVREIGSDYLLGTWQDDLDVEYVVMHAIEKP